MERAIFSPEYFYDNFNGRNCVLCGEELTGKKSMYCSHKCKKSVYILTNWNLLRDSFLKYNGKRCSSCGKKSSKKTDWVVDHITPLFKGGSRSPENLQVLCRKCNNEKTGKDFKKENQ